MGKRQIRILGRDCAARLPEFLNFNVSVILKSNAVFSGSIEKEEDDHFLFRDHAQKRHLIYKKDIVEIILDKATAF
jgi:hypothetical protein